jgi:tetratricopeptide (TPR) repeat protein/transcriptional regulator with XRE-family HTH domain
MGERHENPEPDFAVVLRSLREDALLTQEELAAAAGLSVRTVSDLERGVNRTARKATAELLAEPLGLTGTIRDRFLAAARGLAPAAEVVAARAEAAVAVTGDAAGLRYSLPTDAAMFTGREAELDQITTVISAAEAGGVVAIQAINGMPGVGKTALAIHVAHMLREQFPDRQLFIDLHAYTPGREPIRPEDALAGLLSAAGVDARHLPGDLDARAGLWRDKMAGQQLLLVLDNAASSSQVSPLLPSSPQCLVLVTSRRHLGDLPGGVTAVLLDALPPEQAVQMFTRLVPRAASSLDQVAEVVALAGLLPLAISLLARVFARHPSWTLADLIAETRAGLLTLTAENASVAAAFDVSYRHLDPDRQRLFRLLGLHPGNTIDAHAAAALAGISPDGAVGLLDSLHGEGLLAEVGRRRYGLHDLLRSYARDLAAGSDDSNQALERLLDYYTHTATLAGAHLAHSTRPGPTMAAMAKLSESPALADESQALAWARADRANLLACLDYVTRTGQHTRVIALTAALAGLWRRDGPWADAITRHTIAIRAAQHLGDRLGQANALNDLEDAQRMVGDYPGAARALEQALGIYRDLGDRLGQAITLTNIGEVQRETGDCRGAVQALEQALDIFREIGYRNGQAGALQGLGTVRQETGDYPGALQAHEEALDIYRSLGNQLGQANALLDLGLMRRLASDYPGAARALEQALGIYRDLGNRLGQANALTESGSMRRLTGDHQGAVQALAEALGIYRDLGDRNGEAGALTECGNVRRLTGDYPGAVQALEQALGIFRDLDYRLGQANSLQGLAVVRRLTGDHLGAAQALEQALGIFRDLGYRSGEIEVLNERGTLHRVCGDPALASECHQRALDLARALTSSWAEAHALAGLGRCALATGRTAQAQNLLQNAVEIFQRIGAAETSGLLTELAASWPDEQVRDVCRERGASDPGRVAGPR